MNLGKRTHILETIRNKTAIIGIGETRYYRHGKSPDSEFQMALEAILLAARDAELDPRNIDGITSFSNDRNDPPRIASALGMKDLAFSNMFWGGGGGLAAARVARAPKIRIWDLFGSYLGGHLQYPSLHS